ncbi:leucyl aminopeptidase family protein [Phaeovibrio sulfidiphilus]|uniref:leucyl aminopeptidase family protein n=1 Tax=Phaeovibrio sulfidiphilus TaxID=1220600 RepID=UPI003084265E
MKESLVLAPEPGSPPPVTIRLLDNVTFLRSLTMAGPFATNWFDTYGFRAHHGEVAKMPSEDGTLREVVVGQGRDGGDPSVMAHAARSLRSGLYQLDTQGFSPEFLESAVLFWAMECYRFDRYKVPDRRSLPWQPPRLVIPEGVDTSFCLALCDAIRLVRDLVNTPAEDMGPAELADTALGLARLFDASVTVVEGDALLEQNYPLIHAVGRASSRAPRLIDLRWGEPDHPAVTLVGKGVCFDTGGLDIKPSSNMLLMKKDMGGAAHALGLASLIMRMRLPVRLRVLIGAADNAISGNALRPGDVIRSRKGPFVEIGNTDAEGRLVLADLLCAACEEPPRLLLDFATLTGAARVALGPDLPALFSNGDALADILVRAGRDTHDPLWRLPLWPGYRSMLDSPVADLTNSPDSGFAGAIAAALFLKEFVDPLVPWAHVDLFAWQPKSAPGHPRGGKAQTLRPAWEAIRALSENPEIFAES